jgi:tetratricopeptide (TPR) repeat protein
VVQEETSKTSKRARRRAAGEDSPGSVSETVPEEGPAADSHVEGAPQPAPAASVAPNRQARRSAAAKARAQRKVERAEASALGLDTSEMVDDAFVRLTDKIGRFGRKNWEGIQWIIGLAIIGGVGFKVYSWRMHSVEARMSDALFAGVDAEDGTIGDPKDQGKVNANGVIDPTPIFENDGARLGAALDAYRKASTVRPGSVADGFAQLGEAGVLLEMGKLDDALGTYERLLSSGETQKAPELRAGALLGKGLTLEQKGDLPGSRHAFEELGTISGHEGVALYQQARIAHRQGDAAAAKDLLTKLFKVLGPAKSPSLGPIPDRPDFLRERATELAGVVDPEQKDVKIPQPPLGADAVQKMLEQLQEQGVPAPSEPSQ